MGKGEVVLVPDGTLKVRDHSFAHGTWGAPLSVTTVQARQGDLMLIAVANDRWSLEEDPGPPAPPSGEWAKFSDHSHHDLELTMWWRVAEEDGPFEFEFSPQHSLLHNCVVLVVFEGAPDFRWEFHGEQPWSYNWGKVTDGREMWTEGRWGANLPILDIRFLAFRSETALPRWSARQAPDPEAPDPPWLPVQQHGFIPLVEVTSQLHVSLVALVKEWPLPADLDEPPETAYIFRPDVDVTGMATTVGLLPRRGKIFAKTGDSWEEYYMGLMPFGVAVYDIVRRVDGQWVAL